MSTVAKIVLGIGVLIVVAVGVAFGVSRYLVSKLDGTGNPPPQQTTGMIPYASEDGFSFEYPDRYTLSSQPGSVGDGDVLVLLPKGYVPPEGGEGPPTITVSVARGVNMPLEQWIRTDTRSNFQLSADQQLAQTTIDDHTAYAYRHSGLYETDAVAVAVGGNVYLFSVGWLDASDQTRADFSRLLDSVEFN